MGIIDQLKEIESLKKRLSQLESKIQEKNSGMNAFGRAYSKAGSSDSDFLIQTKGLVKIQWGKKFIDLIKDGKINVDAKFIYKENLVGVKDGIYVIGNGDEMLVILQVGGELINLKGDIGTTYVSFLGEQKTTSELKSLALQNIGFLYKDLNSVGSDNLQNGIIYIESEQKFYTILNGVITEFLMDIPNPYPKLFVIAKTDTNTGALVIRGSGIENSLAFDSTYIYTQNGTTNIKSQGEIYFKVGELEKVIVCNDSVTFSNRVISQTFQSPNALSDSGFRLYISENESTLEIDNLIVRNGIDLNLPISMYPEYWYCENNIIKSVELDDTENLEANDFYSLQLSFDNKYLVGDSLYVYYHLPANEESENISNDLLLLIPFKVTAISDNYITVEIQSDLVQGEFSSRELSNGLINQTIFLVGSEVTPPVLIRGTYKGFDILLSLNFLDNFDLTKIQSRFGDISELLIKGRENGSEIPINGYGIYSNNGAFLNALYTKDHNLSPTDNSTKFASTEWVNNKLIPKGSIIMYNGLASEIPNGWGICDGTNGTPNLIDKFIKAGSSSGIEGGKEEILLTIEHLPTHTHLLQSASTTTNRSLTSVQEMSSTASDRNILETNTFETTGVMVANSYTADLSSMTISESGEGKPLRWEPKYYSLIFIMKLF